MLASKYGPWIEAPKVDGSELRLFCVPPVGMGSSCFHAWAPQLPGVELMPLELPGRGVRMAERLCCDSLVHLAQQALDGIGRGIFESHPFVFFGHSFGAWLAYEMVQELRRRGWPLPLKLYVSANRAPQLHGLRHDPDRTQPALAGLDEESFWHHFERRYGVNPDLQSPYIRAHVRNILQGDFQLLETYGPSSLEKLPLPLCGLCAKGDGRCRPQQLSAWAEVAETFEERWFEDRTRRTCDSPTSGPRSIATLWTTPAPCCAF
ncbi:unnamed protein product [Effrenium voratum]|nr:unnamed protein product [Effrenium voratum]